MQCCFTFDYFIQFLYLKTNVIDLPKKKTENHWLFYLYLYSTVFLFVLLLVVRLFLFSLLLFDSIVFP